MMKKIILFLIYISIMLQCYAEDIQHKHISSYNLPKNKQGIADLNAMALSRQRYGILKNALSIDMQKFSYYWRDGEDAIPSSSFPRTCTKGYLLFPENKQQQKRLGFHNYHCYKKSFITKWKKIFDFNDQFNMIIAVGLWTAPAMYRDQGCEGFYFPLQKKYLMGGCYPAPEHYDDYEDWIRFTAYHFGKYIDHYIVWNEIEMVNWADTSTKEYPRKKMIEDPKFHMKRSFDIYTNLLKRTITAVSDLDKHCLNAPEGCQNLVYVSLTGDWYSKIIDIRTDKKSTIHIKWRNMNLLDYIWSELGLEYDWSIAIHPYGNVYGKSDNALRFSTLQDLSSYQKAQIDLRKDKDRSWLSYPQSRLFASEQNVGHRVKSDGWKEKAKFICESYDIALQMPELVAITHNHFQDNIHQKTPNPTKHTMLPSSVKEDLSDASNYETFRAYMSTTPNVWGKKSNHYCCKIHHLGCAR